MRSLLSWMVIFLFFSGCTVYSVSPGRWGKPRAKVKAKVKYEIEAKEGKGKYKEKFKLEIK